MIKQLVLVVTLLALCLPVFGQRAARSYHSTSSSHATHSSVTRSHHSTGSGHTRDSSSARPYYGGGHHTVSHGGHYQGETNSTTHKGGHYTNPNSGNRYGRHK